MSSEISAVCLELVEIAQKGLGAKDRYLMASLELIDSCSDEKSVDHRSRYLVVES